MLAQAAMVSIGRDPYLVPAVLLACGLLLILFASVRIRHGRARVLARVHVVVACAALASSVAMTAHRAQLFWGARLDAGTNALVIERLLPLRDVSIPRENIARIVELAAPVTTWSGHEAQVSFEIRTTDGTVYRSAPTNFAGEANRTRETLREASRGKLDRFLIGGAQDRLR